MPEDKYRCSIEYYAQKTIFSVQRFKTTSRHSLCVCKHFYVFNARNIIKIDFFACLYNKMILDKNNNKIARRKKTS